MDMLAIRDDTALTTGLAATVERATDYAKASTADNTKRAYGAAWRCFTSWCDGKSLTALPASPTTVALYLADKGGKLKASSLELRVAAIGRAHKTAGLSFDPRDPAIAQVVAGIRRVHGSSVTKKAAATKDILRDAIRAYAAGSSMKAKRDRALLTIGFFAALRRSELVAITADDIKLTPEGIVLTLPRRKTDQEGAGTTLGLPVKDDPVICPVAAYREWIEASGISAGAIFRSVSKGGRVLDQQLTDRDIARIVKAATGAAGYDAAEFSGHSLRAGFITTAATKGVPDHLIAMVSGHASMDTLRGYVRRAKLFTDNAAAMI